MSKIIQKKSVLISLDVEKIQRLDALRAQYKITRSAFLSYIIETFFELNEKSKTPDKLK